MSFSLHLWTTAGFAEWSCLKFWIQLCRNQTKMLLLLFVGDWNKNERKMCEEARGWQCKEAKSGSVLFFIWRTVIPILWLTVLRETRTQNNPLLSAHSSSSSVHHKETYFCSQPSLSLFLRKNPSQPRTQRITSQDQVWSAAGLLLIIIFEVSGLLFMMTCDAHCFNSDHTST